MRSGALVKRQYSTPLAPVSFAYLNHRNKHEMSDMRRVKLIETLSYVIPLRRRQCLRFITRRGGAAA
jgi:hypothetical protein